MPRVLAAAVHRGKCLALMLTQSQSTYRDIGRANYLAPFLRVFDDKPAELRGRHCIRNAANVGEFSHDLRLGEARRDRAVERVDHIRRGVSRRNHAIPYDGVEAGYGVRDYRNARKCW